MMEAFWTMVARSSSILWVSKACYLGAPELRCMVSLRDRDVAVRPMYVILMLAVTMGTSKFVN